MQRFLYFISFFLLSSYSQAQELEFEVNSALFQDSKTGKPVVISQDSILYKGNPLIKGKFNHTDYPGKLAQYVPYSINGNTYLVHDGSGPVLEFRNDSLIACNKTPLFQNQFSSAKFVYKNVLYLFGGYGLFTFKNIVTKYDATTKDWVQVQTYGDEIPSGRARFYSYMKGENLYFFEGDETDPTALINSKKCDNTVWRLHLPSMTFYKMGQFDSSFLEKVTFSSFTANGKLYLIATNMYSKIIEIDVEQNTLRNFIGKNLIKPSQIYFNQTKNEIVCLNEVSYNRHRLYHSNLATFLGKPITQTAFILPFYKEITTIAFGIGIGISLLLLGIALYIKKYKKNSLIPFKGILYKKETGTFYFKNKSIDNLEEIEFRILQYLAENSRQFIPINDLNHLFENDNKTDNYLLIIKKRQLVISGLLQKLTTITRVPENKILINRKNSADKRIKEVMIASSFLKIK